MTQAKFRVSSFAAGIVLLAGGLSPSTAIAQTSRAPNESRVSSGREGQNTTRLTISNVFQKQLELESLDRDNPKNRNYAGARAMASCVVRRSKGKANELFGGPLTNDPQYQNLSNVLTKKYRNCLVSGADGVPMYVVNAALAEQLLGGEDLKVDNRAVTPDFYLENGKITSLEGLSRCLSAHSPQMTLRYLQTKPGSENEKAELANLYGSTPQCGVGEPVDLPEVEQRALLATSLYQWKHGI